MANISVSPIGVAASIQDDATLGRSLNRCSASVNHQNTFYKICTS